MKIRLGKEENKKIGIRTVCFLMTLLLIILTAAGCGTKTSSETAAEPAYVKKLFNKEEISSIGISVEPEAWAEMLKNATAEEYITCDITINGETFDSVGIRPKGNSSLMTVAQNDDTDRFSFKIKFDKYVEGQTYYGLDEIVINNMMGDATYMKEYLSYDLFNYMDVDTPLYAYADISLNDEPWGFYLAVETIEEEFAQRTYGTDYGELYKPESQDMGGGNMPEGMTRGGIQRPDGVSGGAFGANGEIPEGMPNVSGGAFGANGEMPEGMPNVSGGAFGANGEMPEGMPGGVNEASKGGDLVYIDDEADSYSQIFDNDVFKASDSDKNKVIRALKALSTGEDLEKYVDIDEVLRYFAVNTAIVNLDSYVSSMKHNYYLYEKDGEISILPWDLNLSFAGAMSKNATEAVNFPIDSPLVSGISLAQRPLIGNLLNNKEYKTTYHEYLQEIIDGYFNSVQFEEKIDKLNALIGEHVKNDVTAFYTAEEYTVAVEELKTFGKLRTESIQGQLDGNVPATWTNQASEPENLVDSSELNLTNMGSMGRGLNQK